VKSFAQKDPLSFFARAWAALRNKYPVSDKELLMLSIFGAALAYIYRMPNGWLSATFWAEDGSIFFVQDYELGPLAIFETYAGYLHMVMRLFAFLIGYTPIVAASWLYKLASFFVFMSLAAYLSSSRMGIGMPKRALLLLILALFPHGGELFGNLANQMSTGCLLLLVVATLQPPSTRFQLIRDLVVIFLFGLTGPYIFFLAPILVARNFAAYVNQGASSKTQLSWLVATSLALVTSLAAHLYFTQMGSRFTGITLEWRPWLASFSNFFGQLIFSNIKTPLAVSAGASLLLLIALMWIFLKSFTSARVAFANRVSVLLYAAVTVAAASYSVFANHPNVLAAYGGGMRYFIVPYVCILWSLALVKPKNFYLDRLRVWILTISLVSSVLHLSSKVWYANFPLDEQLQTRTENDTMVLKINPPGWAIELDTQECWRCPQ